jgi:ABC-2 type transport system permease protein
MNTTQSQTTPGFTAAFRSEWVKLTTLRSARRNLVLGVGLGALLSIGVAVITGITFDKWDDADRADFDPLLYPVTGAILTVIFFACIGVNVVASEYRTGMIRTTLTAIPDRMRLLLAKAAAVTLLTTVAGVIVTACMYGGSHLVYAHYGLPTADLWSAESLRVLTAGAFTTALFPVIALCITVFTRSTAPALTTVLVMMFLPSMIGGVLPKWWQEHVLVLLPGIASDALSVGHITGTDDYLHPATAAVIVVAWFAGSMIAAITTLAKRDA